VSRLLVAFTLLHTFILKLKDYAMEKTVKKLLCETFFKMFKTEALPNLDMEDFIAMWQALADKWGVIKSDKEWDEFAEEINCVASNRENYFNEIFDKHFNN
jgi:hypothetical protein